MRLEKIDFNDERLGEKVRSVLDEFMKKQKDCASRGHIEKQNSTYMTSHKGDVKVHASCSNCGTMYERAPTSEELTKFYKKLHTFYC